MSAITLLIEDVELPLLVGSVRAQVLVMLIAKAAPELPYRYEKLMQWALDDLRDGHVPTLVTSEWSTPESRATYFLNRSPAQNEIEEAECIFALGGWKSLEAWAAEQRLEV